MSIDYSNFAFPKPKNKEKNIKKVQKIKKKGKRLIKNEKNRYSILTNNLEKCFFCSNKKKNYMKFLGVEIDKRVLNMD